PTAHQTTALLIAPFHGQQHRSTPLTTDSDALEHAQQDQDDRGGISPRSRPRKQTDQGRGDSHHQQGDDEHDLTTDAITPVAEYRSADRPSEESDEVSRESGESADVWGDTREEQVRKHQRRGGPIEEIVVPFDRGSDGTGDC